MPQIRPSDRLGELAIRIPAAARVFQRHALDFCCQGAQTLTSACEEAHLDPLTLITEIEAEVSDDDADEPTWVEEPLPDLIDHILEHFHAPLGPELDRLAAMAKKVESVHGAKDPERFARLAVVVSELREELLQHMRKEEEVLFPWLRAGPGRTAGAPIATMQREHESCASALRELSLLTDRFSPPEGACVTWRVFYRGLSALDADLRAHMHLENNVLFPRALAE